MATAWVTEYAGLASDSNGKIAPVGKEPAITTQTFSFTTHVESAAFNAKTTIVRVYCSASARLAFGAAPTAVAGSTPVAATTEFWAGVFGGDKVSVYDGST